MAAAGWQSEYNIFRWLMIKHAVSTVVNTVSILFIPAEKSRTKRSVSILFIPAVKAGPKDLSAASGNNRNPSAQTSPKECSCSIDSVVQ